MSAATLRQAGCGVILAAAEGCWPSPDDISDILRDDITATAIRLPLCASGNGRCDRSFSPMMLAIGDAVEVLHAIVCGIVMLP